jgi:hypothetical protein
MGGLSRSLVTRLPPGCRSTSHSLFFGSLKNCQTCVYSRWISPEQTPVECSGSRSWSWAFRYGTLEGLSGFGYGIGAGLGETEVSPIKRFSFPMNQHFWHNIQYSITAYPGICVYDKECWGNPRGHLFQWFHTSDTSWRNTEIYGDKPEVWDFSKHAAADIVVICIGTNDANAHNNVPPEGYVAQYTMFIEGIHTVWPNAQIVLVVSSSDSWKLRNG